jgi:hypothetical protein
LISNGSQAVSITSKRGWPLLTQTIAVFTAKIMARSTRRLRAGSQITRYMQRVEETTD